MDLAVIYPRLDHLGGAEKFGLKMMNQWCKKHKLTLYSLSTDETLLKQYGVEAKSIICKTDTPLWRTNTLALMSAVKSMRSQIGKHDLYILNMFPTHILDLHPNIWIPHEPPRMLYDRFDDLINDKDIPLINRILMRIYFPILRYLDKKMIKADKVVANSKLSADYIKRVYGLNPEVVYLGADQCTRPRFGGDYVLAVGRLVKEKRLDLAILAMEDVPDLRLKIVGTGPDLKRLKEMGGDNIDFLGFAEEEELKTLYANALCTIFTPVREPFGLVALESIACGTPIIGGLDGGYCEVLEDGIDSFLMDPTPKEIAKKIISLRDNPNLVKKMGEACIEKSKRYTWEKTAKNLLDYAIK